LVKSLSLAFIRIALLAATLALAACGAGGGTSTGGTSTGGGSSSAPTATPKPKPSSAPKVTQAFCESVMTVAEANQIMHPPAPITTISAQSDDELGVCAYNSPQSPLAVVKILIEQKPYTGPNPVPTSTILQLVSQLANDPHVTVTATKPVSGVGDQAEFLATNVSEGGITLYADVIYVIYGKVAFLCDNFHLNTKPDDTAQMNSLQQCGQRVVSQL
jgi:hypothetical protein